MRSREMRCNNSLSCLLVVILLDSKQSGDSACNPCAHHSIRLDVEILSKKFFIDTLSWVKVGAASVIYRYMDATRSFYLPSTTYSAELM